MIRGKRGEGLLQKFVIHIILVGLIFAVFMVALSGRTSARDVKQQILEKEIALLVDAAEKGMSFEIWKVNPEGRVDSINFRDGKIFVGVDDFISIRGYPCFPRYPIEVEELDDKFVVRVG